MHYIYIMLATLLITHTFASLMSRFYVSLKIMYEILTFEEAMRLV